MILHRYVVCGSLLAAVLGLVATARAQDIPTSAGALYGSQIAPPPHPSPTDSPDPLAKQPLFKPRRSGERIVVTDSDKHVEMKKPKFGADVTEPTGVFKKSFLDTDIALDPPTTSTGDAKPKKAQTSASPAASASPSTKTVVVEKSAATIDKSAAPAQDVGLSLQTSPAPALAATPHQ